MAKRESTSCFGCRTIGHGEFMAGLESALTQAGFEFEWADGAQVEPCSWVRFSGRGSWFSLVSHEIAEELAVLVAAQLKSPIDLLRVESVDDRRNPDLSFVARQIQPDGTVGLLPMNDFEGADLVSLTAGRADDRREQVLHLLIGTDHDRVVDSGSCTIFRRTRRRKSGVAKSAGTSDSNRVRQAIDELKECVSAMLAREGSDQYALKIVRPEACDLTIYMNSASAQVLQASLPTEFRAKLQRPGLRGSTGSASEAPKRQYNDTEVAIRKFLAEMLGVDRFTIDWDQPLSATTATADQLSRLMQFICDTYGDEVQDRAVSSAFQIGGQSIEIRDLTIHQLSQYANFLSAHRFRE